MKRYLAISLSVLAIAIIAVFIFYRAVKNNNPVQTPQQMQSSSTVSRLIAIRNFTFNPSMLTIKKGTTVTWMNEDSFPHQIKSDIFNSGLLNQGQSYSFTFDFVGTFDYSCAIHPSMVGKIVVE